MFDHPYAPFLRLIERPGRYVGGEFGAVVPDPAAELSVALAYPDCYEIGMSHIGLSVLYECVNRMERVTAERVFMPWPDLEAELRSRDVPLVSLESARALHQFDVLGFSLQYELTYSNLLAMLDLGGIPRRSADRSESDPLVIVGGPLATQCEPLAPFVDLCVVGEAELALPQLLELLMALKKEGLERGSLVDRLAELPFVFAPDRLSRERDPHSGRMLVRTAQPVAQWARVDQLGELPPGRGPVPAVQAIFDRYSVEVARGCTQGCRFCQAGFLYRPTRERSESQTSSAVDRAVSCLGFDEISLAALSTADHSRLVPMLADLGEVCTPRRVSLSVPSLRAYGLPDEVVEIVSRLRATGVTLAPEAGSQRLRDVINKNITREDLFAAAARFFDWGVMRLKLYFMLGLPQETDDDLAAIVELAGSLRKFGQSRLGGRKPAITISVSTFVPRPFTPFEREPMIGVDEIRRRQQIVEGLARQQRMEVRVHDPRLSVLEGVFCRGDIELAPVLERAVDRGARYDSWADMFKQEVWDEQLRTVDVEALLGAVPQDARLPWSHVDIGVDPAYLNKERRKALDGKTTQPCGHFAAEVAGKTRFVCHNCGLSCDKNELPLRPHRPAEPTEIPPPRQRAKRPQPRAVPQQAEQHPVKIRLVFAKWGRQAFVGHLDTIRALMRSLRRAGLELAYTQGFHPKPKLESSPPLPLGVSGLNELLDVWLVAPSADGEIIERLKSALPVEMAIRSARRVRAGEQSLNRSLTAAHYVALLRVDSNVATQALNELLAAESLLVERTRKKKTKQIDLRPYVQQAGMIGAPMSVEQLVDLRLPQDIERTAVSFKLKLSTSGGAKISELLALAFGSGAEDAFVVRTGIDCAPQNSTPQE